MERVAIDCGVKSKYSGARYITLDGSPIIIFTSFPSSQTQIIYRRRKVTQNFLRGMKLRYAATVSTLAFLVSSTLGAILECPTIKTFLGKSVVSGKSAHYTVKVVTGSSALTNAHMTVRTPQTRGYDCTLSFSILNYLSI